jgi:hypothetical protein
MYGFDVSTTHPRKEKGGVKKGSLKRRVNDLWLRCNTPAPTKQLVEPSTYAHLSVFPIVLPVIAEQEQVGCDSLIDCFKLMVDYGIANPPRWSGPTTIQPDIQPSWLPNTQVVKQCE